MGVDKTDGRINGNMLSNAKDFILHSYINKISLFVAETAALGESRELNMTFMYEGISR